MQFVNFGSIGQFRDIISSVKRYCTMNALPLPTLEFVGSVKLHGTNGGMVYQQSTDGFSVQSRERILTPGKATDNFGFAKYVYNNEQYFKGFLDFVSDHFDNDIVGLYGEWAGCGICSGKSAIATLTDKKFFAFRIALLNSFDVTEDGRQDVKRHLTNVEVTRMFQLYEEITGHKPACYIIFDTTKFPVQKISIDFSDPIQVQNQLVDLTIAVETECPVAKYFGLEGIGEGIVWECFVQHEIVFKVKGEKHSASKVHTVKEIAAVDIAIHNSMLEFARDVVSQNRLEQGVVKMSEMGHPLSSQSTSHYIKWVTGDVVKEEGDTIAANGFDVKKLTPMIVEIARNFWFKYLKEQI